MPSVVGLVWRFAAAGLIALGLVLLASVALSQSVGRDVALDEARRIARLTGVGIIQPALDPGILTGDATSLSSLNQTVIDAVLGGSLVRVKLWQPDGDGGTILYSDESRLIGEPHPWDEEKQAAIASGDIVVEESDLSSPENRFEASQSELLEVYLPIDGPDGAPLLYEAYFDLRRVNEAGRRVWTAFAPLVIGGLLVLQLVQVPLAWSMARRLRDGAVHRQQLLVRSLESSALERRRIAGDLHDGVVQDLAGLSFELSAVASAEDPDRVRETAESAATTLRANVGALRTLLVDIYPPDLDGQGLASALEDLLARHRAAGRDVQLDADVRVPIPRPTAELVHRIAQEALRNVDKHAGAGRVVVTLTAVDDRLRLRVDDDGSGFDPTGDDRDADGHFGLRLLADSARELGGLLTLSSGVGAGTAIELEVPL
ncbi:sensor histidine kinase [Euzebya rosea]|uniref:sensor histidine kinase n=1 Tax=Euzebya rosea TaxID=2052804 RepID=UPI000D3EB44F|nr:histidine kinase [Euzebya rosea]